MLVTTKALVISTVKYQETSLIVKCFTLSDGLKTYFVPNAFSKGKTAPKAAFFQPMTLLNIEAVHKNKGAMERLKEIRIDYPYSSVQTDVAKSTILMFLAEVLHHSIREEQQNEPLFHLLEVALHWFDHHDNTANFHLILMLEMTKHFGFYPDTNRAGDRFFDLKTGHFTLSPDVYTLDETQTNLFKELISLQLSGETKSFSGASRRILLKILVDYYTLHLEGFKKPKSLEILRDVFS